MPQYYNNQDVLPSVKSVAEDSVKPEHDKNIHKTGRNWKSINVILKNRSFLKKKTPEIAQFENITPANIGLWQGSSP